MDWQFLRLLWEVGVTLIAGVAFLASWQNRRQAVTHGEIKELDGRLDRHADRLVKMEETVKHLAGSREIGKLETQMEGLRGDVQVVAKDLEGFKDVFAGMQRQVNNIESYILKGRGA